MKKPRKTLESKYDVVPYSIVSCLGRRTSLIKRPRLARYAMVVDKATNKSMLPKCMRRDHCQAPEEDADNDFHAFTMKYWLTAIWETVPSTNKATMAR